MEGKDYIAEEKEGINNFGLDQETKEELQEHYYEKYEEELKKISSDLHRALDGYAHQQNVLYKQYRQQVQALQKQAYEARQTIMANKGDKLERYKRMLMNLGVSPSSLDTIEGKFGTPKKVEDVKSFTQAIDEATPDIEPVTEEDHQLKAEIDEFLDSLDEDTKKVQDTDFTQPQSIKEEDSQEQPWAGEENQSMPPRTSEDLPRDDLPPQPAPINQDDDMEDRPEREFD